jgi:hypothetical protein
MLGGAPKANEVLPETWIDGPPTRFQYFVCALVSEPLQSMAQKIGNYRRDRLT